MGVVQSLGLHQYYYYTLLVQYYYYIIILLLLIQALKWVPEGKRRRGRPRETLRRTIIREGTTMGLNNIQEWLHIALTGEHWFLPYAPCLVLKEHRERERERERERFVCTVRLVRPHIKGLFRMDADQRLART